MELKSFRLEKIRIKNFLSFYGNQEVKFSPLTAVTACYSQGKEDFLRAIKFVFGGCLKEIYKENPCRLFHRIFWKRHETGTDAECFVEVTLKFVKEEKIMKLHKGVKKSYFIYKIDDEFVSESDYEDSLNILNVNVERKNVILYKKFLESVIWGAPDDFELFLTNLLRINSKLSEWMKMKGKIDYLKKMKYIAVFEDEIEKIKKTHGTLEKFIEHFNCFLIKRDYFRGCSDGFSFKQIRDENDEEINIDDVRSIQNELDSSLKLLNVLESKESELIRELYVCESKMPPENVRKRIIILKSKVKNLEIIVSSLWAEMKEIENELKMIDNEITINLGILWDLEQSYYLENRLTKYGRLIDYVEPFEFMNLLKEIIGDSTLYGNLCDDAQTARSHCDHLKAIKYERREKFIIFQNYSSRFKDLLLGSGEKGIKIKNIQELQIFLFKLKQYGLIASVPVICKSKFDFKLEEEEEGIKSRGVIYPESGIFLGEDGTIKSYGNDVTPTGFDSIIIIKNVKRCLIRQETMYEEYRELFFQRQITFQNINSTENDINYFRTGCKKRDKERGKYQENKTSYKLSEIYDEYKNNFVEHERYLENSERKFSGSIDESQIFGHSDGEIELKIEKASGALREIEKEKEKIKDEIKNLTKKLRFSAAFSHKVWFPPVKKFVLLEHPKKICNFYYDAELKKLENIMSKQEVEEFEGWKKWRKSTIDSLVKSTGYFAKSIKSSKIEFDKLAGERKKMLSPLVEHFNSNLSSAAHLIVDTSLPFLDLVMNRSEGDLELVSSLAGNKSSRIQINHFNSFLKFIAALVLFFEIANYEQVPILFVDNVQEFLPHYKDTLEAVVDKSILNKIFSSCENANFQMISRISQYFGFFIKKNGTDSKNKKTNKTGPIQIIYFTSEDLVHGAHNQLWIRNMILPDEFLTDACDTFSVMEQIKFD